MVMFLLSCTGIAAKDISSNFENKDKLEEQVNIIGTNKISITNNATIISNEEVDNNNSGNGISGYSNSKAINVGVILNKGKIEAKASNIDLNNNNKGNGIGMYSNQTAGVSTINNTGNIAGKVTSVSGENVNAGNGIGIYSFKSASSIGNLNNSGIIMGSNSAIVVDTPGFMNETGIINNYGILLGKTPVLVTNKTVDINNLGLMTTIDDNGEVTKIENGNQTSQNIEYRDVSYTVINRKVNTDGKSTETISAISLNGQNSNLILNGINNTLTVDKELTLDNSIINAYKTAIEVTGKNIFTGNDVTINGGGLDGQTAVITGDDSANTVKLTGNSIINGNINLGGGRDLLVFGNEDRTSYSGITTYSTNNSTINITGNIEDAETINVNQEVVFGENSKVTGTDTINIGTGGSLGLTLKVDGDKSSHALTGNNVTINGNDSATGDILLITNGIGNGTTVDMTGIKLENISLGLNNILYKAESVGDGSSLKIDFKGSLEDMVTDDSDDNNSSDVDSGDGSGDSTSSDVDSGDGLGDSTSSDTDSDNGSVENKPSDIDSNNKKLEEILKVANGIKYEDLNQIVLSMGSEDINELSKLIGVESTLKKSDTQKEYLVKYLAEIYAASPYSLSSELSRKSADMFENIVVGKDLKPELNNWAIYGGLTHVDGGLKDSYYGIDDQIYTTNAYGVDTESKITGTYVMGEYGLSSDFTTGVIFGVNQGESKLSNGSKVNGDNIYLGAFAKKYLGNLRLLAGVGYQYGDFEADRYSLGADKIRHYDSKYNDKTFDLYADMKYTYQLAENLYLEPNVGISYINVEQDSAKESGNLGMTTSSKDFNYTNLKAGVDVRKDIVTTNMKHSISTGVFYERMLAGNGEEKLEARFNSSEKTMKLLVNEKNKDKLGIRTKYEVALQNGVTFDVKGASYIGNYSSSKYESDKFREYEQRIITHGFTYETVEEQKTGHTLYDGKAFIYGKSNIAYDGDYSGKIENYSLHSYSKLYNDNGYFVKRVFGVNYLDGSINSGDYESYAGNMGTGFGMDRDLKYMKLTTGVDLTLYYLPKTSYTLEDRHNDEYRVTSNKEIIFEINPEVRAETEFWLSKLRVNTYGTLSYEFNKYLLNNAPKMDIHDISTTSGVAERGTVTKIGTDIKIENIGVGLELKYFSGAESSEKVTGTVKASYKF